MKPVFQTVTEQGKGNCLAACVASILEVPIEAVPELDGGSNWRALQDYLRPHNISATWINNAANLDAAYVGYSPGHVILTGQSPRFPGVNHAVVGRPNGYGFEVVHDPHKDGLGISGPTKSVIYFTVLEPAIYFRADQ